MDYVDLSKLSDKQLDQRWRKLKKAQDQAIADKVDAYPIGYQLAQIGEEINRRFLVEQFNKGALYMSSPAKPMLMEPDEHIKPWSVK